MVTVIIPTGADGSWRERLARLDLAVREVEMPAVPALEVGSAGEVVLVPETAFRDPRWPRWRTALARSTRFFVVAVTRGRSEAVVEAMRDGAHDVVADEDGDERWRGVVEGAAASQRLWLELYAGQLQAEGNRLVGQGPAMAELRRQLERLGPTDVTVLLMGESGVGKERVATALHEVGGEGPLVTLNCAAMPRELIEAELFGAERGAYTGAVRSRPGLVEQAAGGTLFLDEVGELDLSLQPKLLRFLETRRARRVGGDAEYSVRLRVVSATNRELEQEVRAGRFRPDLFYRLAEVVLRIPPLRERVEDIPQLARVFVGMANERFGKNVESVEPELILRFQRHTWPGNVRELKSVIDRLVLFHEGPVLRAGWWEPPRSIRPAAEEAPVVPVAAVEAAASGEPAGGWVLPSRSARVELAKQLLAEGKLSLTEIAGRVGIHPSTLFRWRKSGKGGLAEGS